MIVFLRYFFIYLLLLFLQIFVFDNIIQIQYLRPVIFFFSVMILPQMPAAGYMALAFLMGLSYDFFSGNPTPGLNAAACVVLAFMRDRLIRFFVLEDDAENYSTHLSFLGFRRFTFYTLINAAVFQLIVTFLEVFSFQYVFDTLIRAAINTVLSVALIFIFEILLFYRKASA